MKMSQTQGSETPHNKHVAWQPLGAWGASEFVPVGFIQGPSCDGSSEQSPSHQGLDNINNVAKTPDDRSFTSKFSEKPETQKCAGSDDKLSRTGIRDHTPASSGDEKEVVKRQTVICQSAADIVPLSVTESERYSAQVLMRKANCAIPCNMELGSAAEEHSTNEKNVWNKEKSEGRASASSTTVNSPVNDNCTKHSHETALLSESSAMRKCHSTGKNKKAENFKCPDEKDSIPTLSEHGSSDATMPDSSASTKPYKTKSCKQTCVCETCSGSFKSNYSLQRHIRRVHFGEKQHKCPKCTMSFFDEYHLKRHVKGKACNTNRGSSGGRENAIERTFTCVMCSLTFASSGLYQSHTVRAHRGDGPFQCPKCEKKYGRRDHLVRHMRKVH